MWKRQPQTVSKKRLRRSRKAEKPSWSAPLISFAPRTLLSMMTAAVSLWVVCVSQGTFTSQREGDNELSVKVFDAYDYPEHVEELRALLELHQMLPTVELVTQLTTHAPEVLQGVARPTRYESKLGLILAQGDGALVLSLSKGDKSWPAEVELKELVRIESLTIGIASSRELTERVKALSNSGGALVEYRPISASDEPDFQPARRFKYRVSCPQVNTEDHGSPWQLTFACPLRFKHSLDASKGLAQLSWTQSLETAFGTGTAAAQRVVFDAGYDDVRATPFGDSGPAPAVNIRWGASFVPVGEATQDARELEDAYSYKRVRFGLLLQGTNPKRKDLADVIAFGMAALFGAAAAALFEQIATLVRGQKTADRRQ